MQQIAQVDVLDVVSLHIKVKSVQVGAVFENELKIDLVHGAKYQEANFFEVVTLQVLVQELTEPQGFSHRAQVYNSEVFEVVSLVAQAVEESLVQSYGAKLEHSSFC